MHKTYKIDFFLSFPLALNSPFLHFDGILNFAKLKSVKQDDLFIFNCKKDGIYNDLRLPLKFTDFYHCSVGVFDTSRQLINHIYKRPIDRYHQWCSKKKAYLKQGTYRTYMVNQTYIPTDKVSFYFETDKLDEVKKLLTLIPGLGKYVNEGFGWVKYYEIKEVEGNAIIRQGKTMRNLPCDVVSCKAKKLYLRYMPPYFIKSKRQCYLPFSNVSE